MNFQDYLKRLQNLVEVFQHTGGMIGEDRLFIEKELDKVNLKIATANSQQLATEKSGSKDNYLSYTFLHSSDRKRYGKLLDDTENQFTQGQDNFRKTLSNAYNLLVYWNNTQRQSGRTGRGNDAVSFATSGQKSSSQRDKGRTIGSNKTDKHNKVREDTSSSTNERRNVNTFKQ